MMIEIEGLLKCKEKENAKKEKGTKKIFKKNV